MNKECNRRLDICKFILAILVVGIHTTPFLMWGGVNFIFSNVICRIAVPMFATISSYLFYCDTKRSIFKFTNHILRVYIIWTMIYFPLTYMLSACDVNWKSYFKELVFRGSFSHLWYLPSIAVSMVLVYLISKKVNDRNVICICSLLYFIGALGDTYSWLIKGTVFEGIVNFLLRIFITTRNGIFFLPIYVVMGKYIAEHKQCHVRLPLSIVLFSMGSFLLEGFLISKKQSIDTNYYFALLILVPIILLILIYGNETRKYISEETSIFLRRESSLIYYMHYLVLYCCNFIFHLIGLDYMKYYGIEFISAVCGSFIIGCSLIFIDRFTRIKILRLLI